MAVLGSVPPKQDSGLFEQSRTRGCSAKARLAINMRSHDGKESKARLTHVPSQLPTDNSCLFSDNVCSFIVGMRRHMGVHKSI